MKVSATRLYTLIALIGSLPLAANAAPGTLEQVPLFTVNSAKPNILFIADDSTSMKSDIMTIDSDNQSIFASETSGGPQYDSAITTNPVAEHRAGCTFSAGGGRSTPGYTFVTELTKADRDWSLVKKCDHAAEEEWRVRDHTFNTLYYDPSRTYEPWQGTDSNGLVYPDMAINAARLDPNDATKTINLLTQSALLSNNTNPNSRDYYSQPTWATWCSNNNIAGTCEGWRYYYYDNNERKLQWVNDLGPAEQTNFANWFTYHRSREYAAKYALSVVISNTENTRIGYMPINGYDTYAVPINDINDAHRREVLDNIFDTKSEDLPNPAPKTPLNTALDRAGKYYQSNVTITINGTAWSSPIQSEAEGGHCAVNSTILMTDGAYKDSINDGNKDGSTTPPASRNPGNGNDPIYDSGPYADNIPNTLADIAMHYYETDLLPPNSNDKVPNPDYNNPIAALNMTNPTMHQSMRTFVISFGLDGTLDPDGTKTPGDASDTDFTDSNFSWPNPNSNRTKLDDLWHATVNGRGTFVNAASADDLIAALGNAVGEITSTVGSSAQVAFSEFRLRDSSRVYYSHFETNNWGGELIAKGIDSSGRIGNEVWNAAEVLRNDSNRVNTRVILSHDGNGGIPFQWNSLSTAQKNMLTQDVINDFSLSQSQKGQARVDYLRGDDSNESATGYRERNVPDNNSGIKNFLGDIVHSSPTYVGLPGLFYPDSAPFGATNKRYSDFWNDINTAGRDPVIYVGANDGMLHGFDAQTGEEVLAYVPNAVFDNLADLIDPNYSHKYFVDGSPTVADAYFRKGSNVDWRTVLVGGLGAGGRAWYALDVTDPSNFSESNADDIVLWEFSADDDDDVGYSLSRPIIALTNVSGNNGKRWAMITGNGYNSDNGIAKLFIVYLDATPSGGWTLGDDYVEISTGVGSAGDKNGLSSPVGADTNGDGITDRIYAGDLKGNLWVFDLSSSTQSDWAVAYNNKPLFTATNAAGDIQPITAAPTLARNSDQATTPSNSPNILVFFGTGQYLNTSDLSNTETQTFYAVWDQGSSGELTPSNLTTKTIELLDGTSTSGDDTTIVDARLTSTNYVPYGDTNSTVRFGWKLDLDSANAATGERVVTQAIVRDDIVFFSTFTPNNDPCEIGGSTWFMFLDAINGGLPSRPVVDLNNDHKVDDNDKVNDSGSNPSNPGGLRVDGTVAPITVADSIVGLHNLDVNSEEGEVNIIRIDTSTGNTNARLSWRELREK